MAMDAPRETLGYVAVIDPARHRPDALAVLDLDPHSPHYGQEIRRLDLPYVGDELHHFGWNACSAACCPTMQHPHVQAAKDAAHEQQLQELYAEIGKLTMKPP